MAENLKRRDFAAIQGGTLASLGLPGCISPVGGDAYSVTFGFRPGIRRYYVSRAVGHHILHVTDDGVRLDYYGHDARTPTKEFVLR